MNSDGSGEAGLTTNEADESQTGRLVETWVKPTANPAGDSPILFDIEVKLAPPGGYVTP